MFGVLTSFLETATQKAKDLSDAGMELVNESGFSMPQLEKGYNVEDEDGQRHVGATTGTAPTASMHDGWERMDTYIPPQLQSFAAEWSVFLEGISAEENTYCVPISVYLDDASAMNRLAAICGITQDVLESISTEVETLELDPNVMVSILEAFPEASKIRFQIVPKFVVEDQFWKHLLSRLRVYHRCPSMSAVLDAMDILHREPRLSATDPRKYGFGKVANVAELQAIRDSVGAKAIFSQWFEAKRNAARSELQAALSSLQLLQNLLVKKEVSELADSVRESCKYRKTKVSTLLGDLQSTSSKLANTDLDVETGEVYLDLMRLNNQLHDAMVGYQALKDQVSKTSGDIGGASGASSGSSGMAGAVDISSPSSTSCSWKTPTQQTATPHRAAEGGDDTFTADLPWEDDDE